MAKCYYNGVLLPEIPEDILAEYPYAWIRERAAAGYYDLILTKVPFYYDPDAATANGGMVTGPNAGTGEYAYYQIPYADYASATEWTHYATITGWFGIDAKRVIMWSNHDIPNGSATSDTIYLYATEPVPEDEAKPKELPYEVFTDFYPSGSTIYYKADDLTINYVVPVKKYSTYTVTMTEVGNRLRAVYTATDPATITANVSATEIVMNPTFDAGYTFTYFAAADGWMVVYVSNAGELPKISIVTNGAGGDGAPLYDVKYLVRSGTTLYTVTDGALAALEESEVSASVFQTYGLDEAPDGSLLVGLTDPEVLYWHDSQDDLPELSLTVTGTPPLPQVFTSEAMDMTHESIAGINYAEVDASEDVRFAISFDDGATWQAHDGSAWFTVSDTAPGMLASTMAAITAEQWAEIVTLTAYRLRFWLPNVTAYVKSVVIHYVNP